MRTHIFYYHVCLLKITYILSLLVFGRYQLRLCRDSLIIRNNLLARRIRFHSQLFLCCKNDNAEDGVLMIILQVQYYLPIHNFSGFSSILLLLLFIMKVNKSVYKLQIECWDIVINSNLPSKMINLIIPCPF